MLHSAIISGSVEGAAQFLTVLLIFFVVLALTYFTTRFIGKYQKLQGFNRNLEAVETYRLTNNKFLQIVRVGKRYFLLAVGKDEVSLISELAMEDIDLSVDDTVQNDRFKQMFEIARDKVKKWGDKQ